MQELDPLGKFSSESNVWHWRATDSSGGDVPLSSCCTPQVRAMAFALMLAKQYTMRATTVTHVPCKVFDSAAHCGDDRHDASAEHRGDYKACPKKSPMFIDGMQMVGEVQGCPALITSGAVKSLHTIRILCAGAVPCWL